MRKIFAILTLMGLTLIANAAFVAKSPEQNVPVDVVAVRELGLSERNESKSIVEVSWTADSFDAEKIVAFNLTLSITYADGTVISEKRKIERSLNSARIEIPSVRIRGSHATASIRAIDARVTAVISKN